MRPLYTSPRQENIDRVAAYLGDHGIETTITNRSRWNKPTYQRFSYSRLLDNREAWPQVWVNLADHYAQARTLLRELGIEPMVRFGDELAAERDASPLARQHQTAQRIRRIVLLAVAAAFVMVVLRYLGYI